jgi:hypothetical protein
MRFIILISTLALMSGAAFSQDVDRENAPTPQLNQESVSTPVVKSVEGAVEQVRLDRAQLKLRQEMNEEIAARMATEQEAVFALAARLDAAPSSDARLALQIQISDLKQKGRRDLLAIQLKYAERGGYEEQAGDLRVRIERLDEGLSPVRSARSSSRRQSDLSDRDGE